MSKRYYIIPIFVPHKGCPHDCVFCNQKKITGQIEEVTAADVTEKIETYLNTISRENSMLEIAFYGAALQQFPLIIKKNCCRQLFIMLKGD